MSSQSVLDSVLYHLSELLTHLYVRRFACETQLTLATNNGHGIRKGLRTPTQNDLNCAGRAL